MRQVTKDMIVHWHERGYSISEILQQLPFTTRAEVEAILEQARREGRS
ncbi:DUF433 domain-containing protein [Bifidobacterium sp. SMB2]|uniref:DUF433 domain-containing protein n=1 Tax=Bifidobacterium saimiriisciurei TaxID=2661627 RepID=A0ABX0CBI5_9BIFI|nr:MULTISPECIES: DUF433 domain-containing protein [Bifidobacterium]NEG95993.1 DUF433 domain-containing protein [Bifidobacterium sp. SMB2]NEH12458.1 DUF433 domain-containing protein [Bifidobacterium saimiriisciurei]